MYLRGLRRAIFCIVLQAGRLCSRTSALQVFFVVSGYLVFESLCRSTSVVDYLRKRVRRIVPALFFLSFTAEEAWPFIGKTGQSIFFETFHNLPAGDDALLAKWQRLREIRDVANKVLPCAHLLGYAVSDRPQDRS